MINSSALLNDLRRVLRALEADLRVRIDEQASLSESLQAEWKNARDAGRTGVTYTEWLDDEITQAAVHWVLGCVYLRFLEDNHYLERPYLAGPDQEQLALARDRHEEYFRERPTESDREYLLWCFRDVAQLPGMRGLFDERHNPVFRIGLSGDGAMLLLEFWQRINPDTGLLIQDFTDSESATRFLGDLYQDLSESARKRYALLQTPVFVEEFILDRTLTPAIDEFGYREARVIDPTCGSGHFVLGAFQRLFDLWARNEPARNLGDLVQKALDGVYGVDLNPYAVAIARFRLLIAALKACEVTRLKDAPAFRINLAAGDSLLHGRRFNQLDLGGEAENFARTGLAHAYKIEDLDEVNRILGQQYHAVVGNPPYITVKDAALNAAYRARYSTCHMKYSLGVPFTERFFELAITGEGLRPAGYVGMITTNSFMKREFGSKLIEVFLPRVDLTYVIDTSGAYIPGHGTPTVILFGRDRRPVGNTVRTVMGIKGEPTAPNDPAQGMVWRAIITQLDEAGSESAFVSVADTPRATFAHHPWSIGGGGAADLKQAIEDSAAQVLQDIVARYRPTIQVDHRPETRGVLELGVFGITGADDVMVATSRDFERQSLDISWTRPIIAGDIVKDWTADTTDFVFFPYVEGKLVDISDIPGTRRILWPFRTVLGNRATFSKGTYLSEGRPWWEWHQIALRRVSTPLTITFGEVATHNHFALVRGGKLFKQTAPIIKLPAEATEDTYLGLLGLVNSSVACFWLKQVSQSKGGGGINEGHRGDLWEFFYQFASTKVADFPLSASRPIELGRRLDGLAGQLADCLPSRFVSKELPTRNALDAARDRAEAIRRQMLAWQEELDWCCYRLYGLIDEPLESPEPQEIAFGERAFEFVLAHRMVEGEDTTWFARHGSTPKTELPAHWPDSYRRLVQRRIALIESDRNIGLVERPEYKRRWNSASWGVLEQAALRSWLLNRLEEPRYWRGTPHLISVSKLEDNARLDAEFMQVAELYAARGDFDATALVADLLESESAPFLRALRYTESGLRKRDDWERCWDKQWQEDAINAQVAAELQVRIDESEEDYARRLVSEQNLRKARKVGDIPMPPKYKAADFLNTTIWRLRGGLDVPKERFISYPHCSRDADGSLVVAWAGWDHLQQATALASYYLNMKENEGWLPERLMPLLTGIQELVPWLKQWHNEYSAEHATRMGDYFESFVADEARALGFTLADLSAWTPPAKLTAGRGRKKKEAVS